MLPWAIQEQEQKDRKKSFWKKSQKNRLCFFYSLLDTPFPKANPYFIAKPASVFDRFR
jgi:hypothetical protein